MSVAVKVFEPAVFAVTESVLVPATSAALAGSAALASVERDRDRVGGGDRVPVGVDRVDGDVERASRRSARSGVPVLPVAVPGAAVSPGSRIWSFAKAPALIVVAGLVLAVFVPSL